jgi:hypothetical protein
LRDLKEVRLLADYKGTIRRICKVTFSPADSTLYIVPFVKEDKYFYGGKSLLEIQPKLKCRFDEDSDSYPALPHIAIHQSGQIQVSVGGAKAGPLFAVPLQDLRGEHVVTICVDRFDDMPLFEKKLQTSGPKIDQVVSVENGVESGRFVIYMNGEKPLFSSKCPLKMSLIRTGSLNPLFIGIAPFAQEKLGNDEGGITVIAGWNQNREDEFEDFLYLRGQ